MIITSTLAKPTTGLYQLVILRRYKSKFSDKTRVNLNRIFGYVTHKKNIIGLVQQNVPEVIFEKMAHLTYLWGDKHKRRASLCFALIFKHCIILETNPRAKNARVEKKKLHQQAKYPVTMLK